MNGAGRARRSCSCRSCAISPAISTSFNPFAERLVEHLERSGYVVMHKPPLDQHGAPGNLAAWIEKATKLDRGAQLGVLSFLECPSNKPAAIAL